MAANLPNVTAIPFVTTIRPYVVNGAGQPVLIAGNRFPSSGPRALSPPTRS